MMASALYNRDILRLAASLAPALPIADPHGQAERRSPTCGSKVSASLTLDANGRIVRLSLDVHACALGQASAAIVQAEAPGRDRAALEAGRAQLAAYLAGEADHPGDWASMDLLAPARSYPARQPALLLPYEAVLAALDEALEKQA